MKRHLFLIMCSLLIAPLASSCHKKPHNEEKLISYEQLYDRPLNEKVTDLPTDHTKASYGYTLNNDQGHHNWFYGTFKNQIFTEIAFNSEESSFLSNQAKIKGAFIKGEQVARKWISNVTRKVFIDGKLIATLDSTLAIYQNSILRYELAIKAQDTRYINLELQLAKDDSVYFVISGEVIFNPTIQFDNFKDQSLHYDAGKDTNLPFVGDVHPLYVDGQLRNYYLSINGRFTSDMAISDDLVVFRDTDAKMSPTNPPLSEGFATRVFPFEDKFYSFYGAYSRIEYAMSNDGYVFENGVRLDEQVNVLGQVVMDDRYVWGRDPYAFYDPDINRYRIVIMQYVQDRTATSLPNIDLSLYTSINANPHQFSSNAKPLLNLGLTNNEPEVPMMIKIGQRWYLFACLSGRNSNGVGPLSYWIGDVNTPIEQVDWNSKQEHILTGEDLCASQIVEIQGRYYLYGWITRSATGGAWGGTINLPQEVYQKEDGSLGVRLDQYLQQKLSLGTIANLADGEYNTKGVFTFDGQTLVTNSLQDNWATLSLAPTLKRAMINMKAINLKGETVVGVELENSNGEIFQIRYSERLNNIQIFKKGVGATLGTYSLNESKLENVTMTIVAEDDLLEVFVNDQYAVYARLNQRLNNFTARFYTNSVGVGLEQFCVNQLARKNNFQDN